MKGKKLLAGMLSAAMVLGTMAMPAFADEEQILAATENEISENTDQNEDAQVVAVCNGINFTSIEDAVTYAKSHRERDNLYVPRDVELLGNTVDLSQFSEFPVTYVMDSENVVIEGEREWQKYQNRMKDYPADSTEQWYENNKENIEVSSDVKTITLNQAKGLHTLEIADNADVTLKLDGENEVLGNIIIGNGTKLTIEDVSENGTGSLVVYNTKEKGAKLNTSGLGSGYNAAIGSSSAYSVKKSNEIIINSGSIEAYSNYGAAIGGGQQNTNVTITINDGNVKAASDYGAAIGGGQQSDATIIINGGKVDAKGSYGAAIGGGQQGKANVTITGGDVTAVSSSGAAIGGGQKGTIEFITISGGDVTASINTSASAMGAAIGGGSGGNSDNKPTSQNISITGDANVTVLPGTYASISGSSDRLNGYLGAAIGSGSYKWAGKVQDTQLAKNITIDSTGNVTVAKSNVAFGSTTDNIKIKSGSYKNDISDFVENGYYVIKDTENDTFTVAKSKATVIDNATAGGVKVTLNDLEKHESIDNESNAKYELVVGSIESADKQAVDKIKENAGSKTVIAYDIYVQVTENDKTSKADIRNQKVTIELPIKVDENGSVKVYHIVNGVQEEIRDAVLSADRKSITFIAPSFSAYVFEVDQSALNNDEITKEIAIDFAKISDSEYDIVAKAADGKTINGLMTADLTFELTQGNGNVGYSITPAANMAINPLGENRYEFNFDGINEHEATGESITIGRVKFDGYCENAAFAVKAENTNAIHTTKIVDSIVEEYTANGDGVTSGKLAVDTAVINPVTISVPTKTLKINIDFPNAVKENKNNYQKMNVTITGGGVNDTIALGDGTDGIAMTNSGYSFTKELAENTTYTVTVSGVGYRTARYTVMLNNDKTLNFWNNALENADGTPRLECVEVGNDNSKKAVTFLAGDIVKDNNINIYDLSAVVSYFGTDNLVDEHPEYAKYDLNRDGKIDSKDVAYVLVSWGK